MKTINVWLILVSLLVSFSCQTSSDLDLAAVSNLEDKSSPSEASAYERRGEEIQKIALDVATMLRSSDGLRSSKTLSVASMFTLQDDGELRNSSASDANLQVVEFSDNEGYAIVSENTGGAEVLYIADNGKFDKEFYNKYLEPHIEAYRNQWDSYGCPVCGGIGTCPRKGCIVVNDCPVKCTYLICPHQPTPPNNDFIDYFSPKYKLLRGKENLLKTNWPLWEPLNDLADKVEIIDTNGNPIKVPAYIGCNAVAIMQMIAYHMYPEKLGDCIIPWKRFREMDDFEGEDRKLIAYAARYVADQIKSVYGYKKGSKETSANSTEVKKFMLKVGYKNYTAQPYNIDRVMDELDQNRPMFITAARRGEDVGHIWIIDGYKEMQYIQPSNTVVYHFVHCNWGWSRESNQGYCFTGIFYSEQQYTDNDLETEDPNIDIVPNEKAYTERCTIYTGIEPRRL